MNNNGQVIFYSFMLGLVILIVALALAPAVKITVDNVRSESYNDSVDESGAGIPLNGMNCSNPLNNNFIHAACIATDLSIFYFVVGLIFLAGAIVGAKIIFGG